MGDTEGEYYIYGLIDPTLRIKTKSDILSVFYVGKGKSTRIDAHQKAVLKALHKEEFLLEQEGSKSQRIHSILARGQDVETIRFSSGYVNETDAYRAESLTIDLINSLLRQANLPTLTNATPGHHAGFLKLKDHFNFVTSDELDISVEAATQSESFLLVKGTTEEMDSPGQRMLADESIDGPLADFSDRIRILETVSGGALPRRAWDPEDPWDDVDARERGRRYWNFSGTRVDRWLRDPGAMPTALLLGIPNRSGTVIRYAWSVEPDGTWEYFPEMKRWGVPLGKRLYDHPFLGKVLSEERDGKTVQVLAGYASGWREF